MHALCDEKGGKEGRDTEREGGGKKKNGRVERVSSWRGRRDALGKEDVFQHHREWVKWVEERKIEKQRETRLFPVLFWLRRAHARWMDTEEKRCDVCLTVCVHVCVMGSSSCVTSNSVMEETLYVNMWRLCSL